MKDLLSHVLVILGGIVGGIIGGVASEWLLRQGVYAMVLPGGLVGMGAGIFRSRSIFVALFCGSLGLAAGLLTEWHAHPWPDPSLHYFFTHLGDLKPITFIMIGIGTIIAFWIPFRRGRELSRSVPSGFSAEQAPTKKE